MFNVKLCITIMHPSLQVSKPVPEIHAFASLCNSLVDQSFKDEERQVKFSSLDSLKAHTIGVFGYKEDVWKILRDHGELHFNVSQTFNQHNQDLQCYPYKLYAMLSLLTLRNDILTNFTFTGMTPVIPRAVSHCTVAISEGSSL